MEFTYTIKDITLNADEAKQIHRAYQSFLDARCIYATLNLDNEDLAYGIAAYFEDKGWSLKEDLWNAIFDYTHEYVKREGVICTNPELFDTLNAKFNQAVKEGRL